MRGSDDRTWARAAVAETVDWPSVGAVVASSTKAEAWAAGPNSTTVVMTTRSGSNLNE